MDREKLRYYPRHPSSLRDHDTKYEVHGVLCSAGSAKVRFSSGDANEEKLGRSSLNHTQPSILKRFLSLRCVSTYKNLER